VPIYEYRCATCRKRTSVFVRSVSSVKAPACEHCGSKKTERIFSRVAVLKGEDGLDISESSMADIDQDDPRSVARWVRRMSREMGEPLDATMESELDQMEAGALPDDLDDLGDDSFGDE
jgi:putative FmdB family regulatory protein